MPSSCKTNTIKLPGTIYNNSRHHPKQEILLHLDDAFYLFKNHGVKDRSYPICGKKSVIVYAIIKGLKLNEVIDVYIY